MIPVINYSDYSEPEPTRLNKKGVYSIAKSMRSHLGFKSGDGFNAVLSKLGGKIVTQTIFELNTSVDGSLIIDSINDFTIYLPAHTGDRRNRFTIAHELGHYFLHYFYNNADKDGVISPRIKMRAHRAGSGQCEWEANWFASEFLMPANEFKEIYDKYSGDIYLISEHFKVSLEAVNIKAKTVR